MKKFFKKLLIAIIMVVAAAILSEALAPSPIDPVEYMLLGVPSVNSTLTPRQGQVQFSPDTKPIS